MVQARGSPAGGQRDSDLRGVLAPEILYWSVTGSQLSSLLYVQMFLAADTSVKIFFIGLIKMLL